MEACVGALDWTQVWYISQGTSAGWKDRWKEIVEEMKNGRIPEKMIAYLRPKQSLLGAGNQHNAWSFPIDNRETPGFSKFDACQAFVVPADSEAFQKSALDWACGGQIQKPEDVVKVEFENKPFRSLRWVGIDSRSEGGVAYKVLTPEGWLVDLREDVVIECLFEGCIAGMIIIGGRGNGTYFNGEFVWAVMGSQSRLVLVGSKVHQELLESEVRREKKNITDQDLEVGGVYRTRKGEDCVFIGRGKEKGKKYITQQLHTRGTPQQQVDENVNALRKANCHPYWHYSGSFTVVEKVGQTKVPGGMPEAFDKKIAEIRARSR